MLGRVSRALVLVVTCCIAFGAYGSGGLRTIALSGGATPGSSSLFVGFNTPSLNNTGEIAFTADVLVDGNGVSRGVWTTGDGPLRHVALANHPSPIEGADFGPAYRVRMGDDGSVIFDGVLAGEGIDFTNGWAIWKQNAAGGIELLARTGDPAPGSDGAYAHFDTLVGAINGRIAFSTSTTNAAGGFNGVGVWRGDEQTIHAVALSDQPASGADADFKSFSYDVPLNSAGEVAFIASLKGDGVDASNDSSVWSEAGGGGLRMIARGGDPAPGTDGFFRYFSSPRLGEVGDTIVSAMTTGDRFGYWRADSAGGLTPIVLKGQPAPGVDADFRSLSTFNTSVVNASGRLALVGSLEGVASTSDSGVWVEGEDGGLRLVAREGDPAPGTNAVFGATCCSTFYRVGLNDRAQALIVGSVRGSGVTGANNRGVWVTDESGGLRLLLRDGDALDVSDDPNVVDLRVIDSIGIHTPSNANGFASGFNERGEVTFTIDFTDGTSGVFISDLVSDFAPVAGDYDGDGVVDQSDYQVWLAQYGQAIGVGYGADGNLDGRVDAADYAVWRDAYEATVAAAVPEPSALAVLAVSLTLSAVRPRRTAPRER